MNTKIVAYTLINIGIGFALILPKTIYASSFSLYPLNKSEIISFHWMIIVLGGIIMITLTYVSWKKYNAIEKKNKKDKRSERVD